jgi:cytochrome c oxidase subunit 2
MVTQFSFTPTVTTEEMRLNPDIVEKVKNINELRQERKVEIEEAGQDVLYEFDYLLLCNKICGKSHYNMQMKIIVEEQEEFDAWIAEQTTFANSLLN